MSLVSDQTQLTIAEYRQLARDGQATREQLRHALNLLRGDRQRAGAVSTKSKTAKAAAKAPINSDDLLSGLEDL